MFRETDRQPPLLGSESRLSKAAINHLDQSWAPGSHLHAVESSNNQDIVEIITDYELSSAKLYISTGGTDGPSDPSTSRQ
jgi:hypothetical protein